MREGKEGGGRMWRKDLTESRAAGEVYLAVGISQQVADCAHKFRHCHLTRTKAVCACVMCVCVVKV